MILLDVFVFVGVAASAVSGALLAIKKQLDFFGIIMLGLATALCGGIIRDLLIGYNPPLALRQPFYTIVGTITSVLVMFFPKKFSRLSNMILIFDAVGLAVFTAVGAKTALQQEYSSIFITITIGAITGVGGGIIRDIIAKEIPLIFRKEIYATASIIGALSMALSQKYLSGMIPLYICFVTTLAIRLFSLYFRIHRSNDLPVKKDMESFL